MSEGLTLLNSELRSPLFVQFMRQRAVGKDGRMVNSLPSALQDLLQRKLQELRGRYDLGFVLPLPSHTWQQREFTTTLIGHTLDLPVYVDLLDWEPRPAYRQGQLHNNDQRRENVKDKLHLSRSLPTTRGAMLLLEDYTGSGATLKEAVRVLRKQGGFKGDIVPLTMARVKWRLGAGGMV